MAETQDHIKKLGELIKEIRVAMLTTMDENGIHRSRPMATQEEEFDGNLWFFTSKSSGKIFEIRHEQNVNLSYADTHKSIYVSVSGSAALVDDREKAKQLWTPAYKAWFPNGVDDPNLTLLKVHVEQAEYWDTPGSAVVHLIGFVKAVATGQSYRGEAADHAKIEMPDTVAV